VEGYDAATYGDRFADVYDEWYDDPVATDAAVAALVAGVPAGGRVLELGVGTGRLALPLVTAGLDVTGLDASAAMLERLAAKPGGGAVTAVAGDMAGPLPDGPFDLVLVARNTFFNLTTEAAQRACLAEVARILAPDGRLVVEAFVPTDDEGPTSSVDVRRITADRVVLAVDRHDRAAGELWSAFVDISADGIRIRPAHVRYLRPADLDALAAEAGLDLVARTAGWDGAPFDDDSPAHVSSYGRA